MSIFRVYATTHFLLGSLYTLSCHTLGVLSFSNRSMIMGKATSNTYPQRDILIFHSFFFISTCTLLSFSTFVKLTVCANLDAMLVKLSSIFNNKAQFSYTWATDYKTMLKKYKFIVGGQGCFRIFITSWSCRKLN